MTNTYSKERNDSQGNNYQNTMWLLFFLTIKMTKMNDCIPGILCHGVTPTQSCSLFSHKLAC